MGIYLMGGYKITWVRHLCVVYRGGITADERQLVDRTVRNF